MVAKITQTMDYHEIQNRVIANYPETVVDLDLIYDGDVFTIKKENGRISYQHDINNALDNQKKITGAYCLIRNRRGESLTVMNKAELDKCRSMSKNRNEWSCWNQWTGEMCLKTVLKRACKRYFYDEVSDLLEEDNKNYDPTGQNVYKPEQKVSTPFQQFMNLIKTLPEDRQMELMGQWEDVADDTNKCRELYKMAKLMVANNGRNI